MEKRVFTKEEITAAKDAINILDSHGCDIDGIGWSRFENSECYIDYDDDKKEFIVSIK